MNKETVKSIRLYLNMSQAAFADHVGVAESTIAMIEAGHRVVTDKIASRIARKFKVTPEFFEFVENHRRLRGG